MGEGNEIQAVVPKRVCPISGLAVIAAIIDQNLSGFPGEGRYILEIELVLGTVGVAFIVVPIESIKCAYV